MPGLLMIMVAGFAGSFHCVGMCGGFACGISAARPAPMPSIFVRNLLYNCGRIVTYIFIGALAGQLGAALTGQAAHGTGGEISGHLIHTTGFFMAGDLGAAQRALAIVAGALMALMALQLLGLVRVPRVSWLSFGDRFFVPSLRALLKSPSPGAPLALGVVNGFLPCPLVLAFAVMATATGSALMGGLTMAAFGLGTLPAMLFMGLAGRLLDLTARKNGVRLAGCFVLLISAVTLLRGLAPGMLHMAGHGT